MNIFDHPEVERARKFAEAAFRGQTRLGDGASLITHSIVVAEMVHWATKGDELATVSAILHDVVEDTQITTQDIECEFGELVSDVVFWLTDPQEWESMPFLERKRQQASRLAYLPQVVKVVKLADQIANVEALAVAVKNWSDERCLEYAKGALYVACACRSSHMELWTRFITAYEATVRRHMVLPAQTT